ncbi:unnamed protein product, partial [Iphiclides podalirius]
MLSTVLTRKKANQELNARMTESVCYVITSQLFGVLRPRIGRSSSWRFGRSRPRSGFRARGPDGAGERQVGRERRPGAACGLDSYIRSPPPPPRCLPLSRSAPSLPRNHIIYDSIRARSNLAILY